MMFTWNTRIEILIFVAISADDKTIANTSWIAIRKWFNGKIYIFISMHYTQTPIKAPGIISLDVVSPDIGAC